MTPGGFTLYDDSGNTIHVQYSKPDDSLPVLKGESVTADGLLRSQTAGKRFHDLEGGIYLTGAEYRALVDFLTNGSTFYFFTPDYIPTTMDVSDFPLAVNIKSPEKGDQSWNGEVTYWLSLEVDSVELI